jgi:hypothetical protein
MRSADHLFRVLIICVCVCVCVRARARSRNVNNEAAQAQVGLMQHRKINPDNSLDTEVHGLLYIYVTVRR